MRTKSELEDFIKGIEDEVEGLRDECYHLEKYLRSLYTELDNGQFDGD